MGVVGIFIDFCSVDYICIINKAKLRKILVRKEGRKEGKKNEENGGVQLHPRVWLS